MEQDKKSGENYRGKVQWNLVGMINDDEKRWTREVVGADKRLDVAEKTRFLSYVPSVRWLSFPRALTKWKILSLFQFASRKGINTMCVLENYFKSIN